MFFLSSGEGKAHIKQTNGLILKVAYKTFKWRQSSRALSRIGGIVRVTSPAT